MKTGVHVKGVNANSSPRTFAVDYVCMFSLICSHHKFSACDTGIDKYSVIFNIQR